MVTYWKEWDDELIDDGHKRYDHCYHNACAEMRRRMITIYMEWRRPHYYGMGTTIAIIKLTCMHMVLNMA